MMETMAPGAPAVSATHDHLWRRMGPRDAQYGVVPHNYQCGVCLLTWPTRSTTASSSTSADGTGRVDLS